MQCLTITLHAFILLTHNMLSFLSRLGLPTLLQQSGWP